MSVQALEQDGAGDLVWLHSGSFHFPHEAPNLGALCRGAFHDEAVHEFVERDAIWLKPLLAHLLYQSSSFCEVFTLKMGLDEGVVGDDVNQTDVFRLSHPGLGCLKVPAFNTSIQNRVVHNSIDFGAAVLQSFEDLHSASKVARSSTVPDHGNVLGNVSRGRIQEVLREIFATAAHRRVHEASLQTRVEANGLLKALRTGNLPRHELLLLLVDITSLAVLFRRSIEADEGGRQHWNPLLQRLHVGVEFIGQLQRPRLRAKGQHGERKVGRHGASLCLDLFEEGLDTARIVGSVLDQQGVGGIRNLVTLGADQLLHLAGQDWIP
mmetsp:Transcript_6369/g.14713  ORF Transcript_6369/g.14713 Transcript_6369/m.14713 type:complete len:323 (+) Transcript_6369:1440-2408(+)